MSKIILFFAVAFMLINYITESTEMPEIICEDNVPSVTIALDANITTGFEWTAFVVAGDSAVINENESGYVSDAASDSMLCGVGGTHYFVINAVKPGESIIRFTYSRSWGEVATVSYTLVTVTDDMQIYTSDVTDACIVSGKVTSVDTAENTCVIETAEQGEVIAAFPADMPLPAEGEGVSVYTNGIMTMSLPPITNALGWESVPDENARAEF